MPALDGEPTAALLADARARGSRLRSTRSTTPPALGRVHACLPYLDLITPSLAEARGISGEARSALRGSLVPGSRRPRGGDQARPRRVYVVGPDFEGHIPACRVVAVDGTGAGDAFAAGLLYGRLAGWPLERSARLANAAGALATTAVGATEGLTGLVETLALAGLETTV